ncbi:DUF2589 domain-containing protein [uncultured Bacteroides sp.]|uniref:DUF2589 domain-containing protein n=1 Tax=uncultured Bacteroides sp. TaxID=162156 RepID=UPI0025F88D40|nr:DUF2589 domain-containing protein [uncultured Bacteroides sp.]
MADNVSNNFKGLPIAELIAAPLTAACDSQKKLAKSAFEFMTEIGFQDDGKTPRLLNFNLQRPVEGSTQPMDIQVQAPFLGLVPLPSLLVDDVQIDFQMEVTTTEKSTETTNTENSVSASSNFKFGCFASGSVSVNGKVSSSRENTRSTNQTAKYQVHVSARQQQPTEGLSKLMDIMASCVEPLKLDNSSK